MVCVPMKVAVVSPYYKEAPELLDRCNRSVQAQTHPCTHFMVADGHPVSLFDGRERTEHIVLPHPNGDYGNTPRAIVSLLAAAYGYDAVAFLDADNWFEPDHIEGLIACQQQTGAAAVTARRRFFGIYDEPLPITEAMEEENRHVDTSCWLVFRPAFSLFNAWLMPKELASVGDRIFFQKALFDGVPIAFSGRRTVWYRSTYAFHYRWAGLPVPDTLKDQDEHYAARAFLLSEEGRRATEAHLGFYPGETFRW